MEIAYALFESKRFTQRRRPTHAMDFGDNATVGLNIKKRNQTEYEDGDFAVYLGQIDGVWVVGLMKVLSFTPYEAVTYETLDDLKSVWRLD